MFPGIFAGECEGENLAQLGLGLLRQSGAAESDENSRRSPVFLSCSTCSAKLIDFVALLMPNILSASLFIQMVW